MPSKKKKFIKHYVIAYNAANLAQIKKYPNTIKDYTLYALKQGKKIWKAYKKGLLIK